MNKKSGFTLAEVLVTLMIIGVIAAMTIPSLMQSTAKQEYKVALKKAVSTINQAAALNYALEGIGLESSDLSFLTKRMNVISGNPGSGMYTADGIWYQVTSNKVTVDVNGAKKPNIKTTSATDPKDIYELEVVATKNTVRAAANSAVAQIMYDSAEIN